MPKFIVGARLHDYGKGSPDELFGRVAADGFAAVQLAYKKCVPSVRSYADVTDALVAETVAAEKAHSIQVAVLGTYVELASWPSARRWVPGASAPRRPAWKSSLPVRPARKRRSCSAAVWRTFCPPPRHWA